MDKNPNPKADPVRAAAMRKLVMDYLETQTKPIGSRALLTALAPQIAELGLSRSGAYYHIRAAAKDKQIKETVVDKQHVFSAWDAQFVGPHEEQTVVQAAHERAAVAHKAAAKRIAEGLGLHARDEGPAPGRAPTEVELVVGGVTIVVGRNPTTGRLRITIEG